MLEKTKNIGTIVLAVFIIFSIIYAIVSWIISLFQEPDLISTDEIQLYAIDSNLVTDHSTFYYIKDCLDNLVEAVKQEKFKELYKLYINDYKEQYTEEEVYAKLKEFSVGNAEYSLNKVYSARGIYILEYSLNGNTEYMFMQLGAEKDSSYNFAIVK